MGINDKVGKRELIARITGQKNYQMKFQGDIPDFEIHPDDVDRAYLLVKKMQRCYYDNPNGGTSKYYAPYFSKVENAFLSQDAKAFEETIKDLLSAINAD